MSTSNAKNHNNVRPEREAAESVRRRRRGKSLGPAGKAKGKGLNALPSAPRTKKASRRRGKSQAPPLRSNIPAPKGGARVAPSGRVPGNVANLLNQTPVQLHNLGVMQRMVLSGRGDPTRVADFVAAGGIVTGNSVSGARAVNFREKREERAPALGDPNKVGRGIDALNDHRNLSPAPLGPTMTDNRALDKLMKAMDPKACMSPDGQRYCALLDKPLSAPWGDEGEIQVRPVLYDDIVPPSTTITCRQFGQTTVSSVAGSNGTIVVALCAGAGNQQDLELIDSDTTRFAAPVVMEAAGIGGALCFTPGAPNDQRVLTATGPAGQQGGRGVAGYWYQTTAAQVNEPPCVDAINITTFQNGSGGPTFGAQNLLAWGSPAPFGAMLPDDSSTFKFRPVAAGLLITPVDAELTVGGEYNVSIIPQATNESYVRVANPVSGHGQSTTIQDFYALPDHKIQRADNSILVSWLPSRQDYAFLQTHALLSSVTVPPALSPFPQTPLVTTEMANARLFVQIIPPEDGQAHRYTVSYVAFYEVAGRCIQTEGTVPRPQPTLGAKIATSVQNNLNVELRDRSAQVSQGASFEIMKDHPKIGPMIENVDSHEDVKSTFENILDFGKELLPLASLLL